MSQPSVAEPKLAHSNIIKIQNQNLVRQNAYLVDEVNKLRKQIPGTTGHEGGKDRDSHPSEQILGFFGRARSLLEKTQTELKDKLASRGELAQLVGGVLAQVLEALLALAQVEGGSNPNSGSYKAFAEVSQGLKQCLDRLDTTHPEAGQTAPPHPPATPALDQQVADFEAKVYALESQIESLKWKNHILEKRLLFGQNAFLQQSQAALDAYMGLPDVYCYCGGKFLSELYASQGKVEGQSFLDSICRYLRENDPLAGLRPQEAQATAGSPKESPFKEVNLTERHIQFLGRLVTEQTPSISCQPSQVLDAPMQIEEAGTPKGTQPQIGSLQALADETQLTDRERFYKTQIQELQKSNKALIEIAESRRIDCILGAKKFTETNLFKQICAENDHNIRTINTLEAKLGEVLGIIYQIEEHRRREVTELRDKHLREREKGAEETASMRTQLADLQRRHDLLVAHQGVGAPGPDKAKGVPPGQSQEILAMIQNIQKKIQNVVLRQNQSITQRDKIIKELEGQLQGADPVFAALRNQDYEGLFTELYRLAPQLKVKLDDLHRHLKSREDKIRMMAKELQAERSTNESFMEEVANNMTILQTLKSQGETFQAELETATANLNIVFKDRQVDKATMTQRITELEAALVLANEKMATRGLRAEGYFRDLKEGENARQLGINRMVETVNQYERLKNEKAAVDGQLMMALAQKEELVLLLEEKKLTEEGLTRELARFTTEACQNKAIQRELLSLVKARKIVGGSADPSEISPEGDHAGTILTQNLELTNLKVD